MPRGRGRRLVATAAGFGLVLGLAACDDINTTARPDEPLVLTGAQLTDLVGLDPDRIVAFAHSRPGGVPTWTQVPVQIDERRVVAFGAQPGSNATPGVAGTVYGNGSGGPTALQYADPGTFVGADPDATFDADDELVLLSSDGGGKPRPTERTEPPGVVPGSGVQVQFDDPLVTDQTGWVYLFESHGSLDPAAGRDDVTYSFELTSGDYRSTYLRADGPNPETSWVQTDTYRIGFSDRWYEDEWRVTAGGATGVDVLDGVKNRFGLGTCARSNLTFNDGEGAFVANIDGPIRAIRSYVGANSGPLTQRTHLFYPDREETVTALRVHAIPGIMDHVDFSEAAIGMTSTSSTRSRAVTVDGVGDNVDGRLPAWNLVTGPQGSVFLAGWFEVSYTADLDSIADGFYRDKLDSAVDNCWGDPHFLGANGITVVAPIPNTDPRTLPFESFEGHRVTLFAPPGATSTDAAEWHATVAAPLTVTISPYSA